MTVNSIERQAEELQLVNRLVAIASTKEIKLMALQVRDRIRMPMENILRKVPGSTATEKSARVGVSRETWYSWKRGESRPNSVQAKRLAELTKISINRIYRTRGQIDESR